jgi:hypothetical protein
MRASLVLIGAALFLSCGNVTYLPDGGRARQSCGGTQGHVPVKVVDGKGQPIEGLDVTATHTGTGKTVSGKTDANGATDIVNSDLGDGVIHVVAGAGSHSAAGDVTVTCGECLCTAYPTNLELTVQ